MAGFQADFGESKGSAVEDSGGKHTGVYTVIESYESYGRELFQKLNSMS